MSTNNNIQTIDVQTLKAYYDKDKTTCILDVREQHEWDDMHIASAIHIPKGELIEKINEQIPDHKQNIYIHCLGGVRSLDAAKTLMELGYLNVYSVAGGIKAWINAGYEVV